jgi:hypothetical protein
VPFLLKSGAHEGGDFAVVLDDKDTHVPDLSLSALI